MNTLLYRLLQNDTLLMQAQIPKYISYTPKWGYSKNIRIWIRKNINYRRRNFAKQNESEHDDWADVECHKSRAKNIKKPKTMPRTPARL